MTKPIRPQFGQQARAIVQGQRQVEAIRKTKPPRPIPIKAGTPSDADYTAATMPPLGTIVYDTVNSKIWVRHAVGVWKGVVVA